MNLYLALNHLILLQVVDTVIEYVTGTINELRVKHMISRTRTTMRLIR